MPRRISKKVSKIMDASALEKFKDTQAKNEHFERYNNCLLYTSPSPRDRG